MNFSNHKEVMNLVCVKKGFFSIRDIIVLENFQFVTAKNGLYTKPRRTFEARRGSVAFMMKGKSA